MENNLKFKPSSSKFQQQQQSSSPTTTLDFTNYFITENKEISYLLQCLHSQSSYGRIVTQMLIDMIAQLLTESKEEEVKFIILSLIAGKTKFIDYKKFIIDTLRFFNKDLYLEKVNRLQVLSGEFSWIREVIITPTRRIYIESRLQRSCRAVRKFGPHNFISVKFCDESKEPMQGINKKHPVFSIVRNIFANGILIDGENYSYVGNSNSQLRDYSAWFVNDKIGAQAVRRWTEISHVDNPRKFFRAISLMFSTTIPTSRIYSEHYHNDPTKVKDIERNGHNFTEGCGEIGSALSKYLNETYKFKPSTCAYQVRIGGCKGMLVVNNLLNDPMGVYIRPSMVKFETKDSDEHRTLEVCSVSTTSRCKLNRQVISLLSTLGTKDSVFFSLQDRYLNQLATIINDVNTSRQLIDEFFPDITESELFQDTYIRRILITLYKLKMERCQQKSHVEIECSRNLLGVADPTGTLPANTVFVQLEDEDVLDGGRKYEIVVTGLVMVIKNPCTHPGDVRYLTAIDNIRLRHLRNVLVFSTQGQVPNFKEISGSDLDGDRYFFCFDKDLIGSRTHSEEAYLGDIEVNAIIQPKNNNNNNFMNNGNIYKNSTLLVDTYFTNVERQALGTMYNAHLAICDLVGATNELAIEVSKECFKEIDYAKTGVHGDIPKAAKDLLNEKGYPHFMRKELSTRDYYQSKSVMGLMYDQIDQLVYIGDFLPDISVDETNLIPGFESYLEDAYILYREYKLQVHSLLQRYGSESEESLMVGFFDQSSVEEKVSKDVKNEMKSNYKKICEMFENEFLKEFGEQQREITLLIHFEKIEKKISAWYYVAYNDKDPNRVLGFYWIARSFKKLAQQDDSRKKRNIMVNSILNHMDVKRAEIIPLYERRLQIAGTLTGYLNTLVGGLFADCKLEFIGSTSSLLFEPESNISFYLKIKDLDGNKLTYYNKLVIIDELRDLNNAPVGFGITNLVIQRATQHQIDFGSVENKMALLKLPILKFNFQNHQITISFDELQWKESIIQQEYIEQSPIILSLLFCIIDWGVKSSFIPSFSNLNSDTNTSPIATSITRDKNLTKSNIFYLLIQFCIDTGVTQQINDIKLFESLATLQREYGNSQVVVTTNKSLEWWDDIFEVSSRYFFIENKKQQKEQQQQQQRKVNRNRYLDSSSNKDDTYIYNITGLGDTILSFFRYYSDRFGSTIYENKKYGLFSLVKGHFSQIIDSNIPYHKSTLLFYQESFRHALHSLSTFVSIDDFLVNLFKSKKKTMFIRKNQLDKLRKEKDLLIHRVKLTGCKISIANINLEKGVIEIEGIPQHIRHAQNEIRNLLGSFTDDISGGPNAAIKDNLISGIISGGLRENTFLTIKSDYKNNKSRK